MDFRGSKGYIKLVHPDLTIEFLVPELGRGFNKPYPIPQFGINAQPLRYLGFLLQHTISVTAEDLHIIVPHPAAYILHKFIIFKRRKGKDKHDRDLEGALRVYQELIKENKHSEIKRIFKTMHSKWQETVLRNLKTAKENEIISLLSQ